MEFSNYSKILIIRLSSLGDLLLTTPLIRTLKNRYPNITIDFILREEFKDILKLNPHINDLILLKRDYDNSDIKKRIENNNYDLIIDLQNNLRSRRFTLSAKSKVLRYKKPYIKRLFLVLLKINKFKNVTTIPVRYANTIPDFHLDEKGLELFLPENLEKKISSNLQIIGFCPGSRHKTKMWPKEYFIRLGNQLLKNNYKIALFGGKEDRAICKEISDQIEGAVDLSNDNNLFELAVNMQSCKLIVCNDSGLMHTALAVNVPVCAIFGSTVKELGFFPYKGKNLVLENNSLSCRPCSHIGRDECPKKHLKCMKDITSNYVFEELNHFMMEL